VAVRWRARPRRVVPPVSGRRESACAPCRASRASAPPVPAVCGRAAEAVCRRRRASPWVRAVRAACTEGPSPRAAGFPLAFPLSSGRVGGVRAQAHSSCESGVSFSHGRGRSRCGGVVVVSLSSPPDGTARRVRGSGKERGAEKAGAGFRSPPYGPLFPPPPFLPRGPSFRALVRARAARPPPVAGGAARVPPPFPSCLLPPRAGWLRSFRPPPTSPPGADVCGKGGGCSSPLRFFFRALIGVRWPNPLSLSPTRCIPPPSLPFRGKRDTWDKSTRREKGARVSFPGEPTHVARETAEEATVPSFSPPFPRRRSHPHGVPSEGPRASERSRERAFVPSPFLFPRPSFPPPLDGDRTRETVYEMVASRGLVRPSLLLGEGAHVTSVVSPPLREKPLSVSSSPGPLPLFFPPSLPSPSLPPLSFRKVSAGH